MNGFKRYLLYIFLVSIFFFRQVLVNDNNFYAQENLGEIQLYENTNLFDMDTYVQIVPSDFSVPSEKNKEVNLSVEDSTSLLNIEKSVADEKKAEEYVNDNLQGLVSGYEIKIDEESYYTDSMDNITWVKNQIYKILAPNEKVAQELIETGMITPYMDGDKRVTKITIDNEVTIQEKLVPENKMITDKKVLLEEILFASGELKYDTIGDETLEEFALRNGITVDTLKKNNPSLENNELFYAGQEFIINDYDSPLKPTYYYEQTVQEVVPYSTETIQDSEMNLGTEETVISGVDGLQDVVYEVKEVEGELIYSNVLKNEVIQKPIVEVKRVGTHEVDGLGTGTFIWPSDSHKVSCGYGCYSGHTGTDIQNYYGAPIFAADNGTVTYSGCTKSGYGCHVIIDHNNGYSTLYGHMSETSATVGTNVSQGEVIGYEGNTGNVSGANGGIHLHFEIRYNGVPGDPMQYY